MDKYIGKLLDGRYEVMEVIGVGGMSVVYKARCRVLNRFVAIKILKDEFAQDEEFRHRFYIESQAVAKLSHNNIVSVYDVSHSDGLDYIVMELIEGKTLKEYLQAKGRLTWQETLFFSEQITRALDHAHSRGIIHQDIKPQNIIVLRDGTAKVTDFGIASFAATEDTRVVQEAIGSVHYISPEQAKGSRIDYRTDIYSLGVVMYEMLTGKLPFQGDTPLAIVMQHINAVPLLPSAVVPGIPQGMDQIVMRAMCPNLSQRYGSAQEALQAMLQLKNDPQVRFAYGNPEYLRNSAPSLDSTQPIPRQPQQKPQQPMKREAHAPKPQRKKSLLERISQSPAAIAALAVSGFAAVAIVIALAMLFGGNGSKIVVPSFVNLNIEKVLSDAVYQQRFQIEIGQKIENAQLDEGTVVAQSIERGTRVKTGEVITLDISTKPAQEDMTEQAYIVEDFTNLPKDSVDTMLTSQEILHSFREEESEEVDEGNVIRTDPVAGEKLNKNAILIIYVSTGKPDEAKTPMPSVLGMTAESAQQTLESLGLRVTIQSIDSTEEKGRVLTQSIERGTEVAENTRVTLEVSNGIDPNDPEEKTTEGTTNAGAGSETTTQSAERQGSRQVTIAIPPEATENVHVVIRLDTGEVVYDHVHDTLTQPMLTVTISGSGSRYAYFYVNDEQVGEQSVTFN